MTIHCDPNQMTTDATPVILPAALATRADLYRGHTKRVFDIVVVLLALPVIVPLIAVLALIARLDGGPAFYSQYRLGRGGRRFRMWKLRSMIVDADAALAAHLAADPTARAEWNRHQKLALDPRITRLGRFIRRTSLDELPQLWNVLTGEMSLVGPRPMLPEQRNMYPGRAYFRLRPGLTGSWQVSDRNATSFAARAEFDLSYDRALSFVTDLFILAATIGVVLRATGR